MGGCATKPKADATTEPVKEESLTTATVEAVTELKEVEPEVGVDDNKRQSLSNLFMENERKKQIEVVETPTETNAFDEMTESEKPKDISGGEAQEPENVEKLADKTPRDVVEVPVEAKTEKAETIQTIIEKPEPEETKTETTEEEKIIEETPALVEAKIEKEEIVDTITETQKPVENKTEALEEEKVIEETLVEEPGKPEIETTPVLETIEVKQAIEEETPKEDEVEEEKLVTETQVPETSEEKKVVEEIPVEEFKSSEVPVEKNTDEEK